MRILILVLFVMPFLGWGQVNLIARRSTDKLGQYVYTYSQVGGNTYSIPDLSNFIKKLERKEIQKKDTEFIRLLYSKTRHEFLKHYAEYASFSETISKGRYNCLTGTALYALLLEHFGIDYKIIETNYHIFLLAYVGEGKILFEATDPLNGFVENPKDIGNRIKQYKQNRVEETAADKKYYRYNFELYNEVTLDQMEGLLHFNLSIVAYNQQDLSAAIHHLGNALELYNSPRITEFSSILLLSVLESKLDKERKENCLKTIQAIRRKQVPVMASRSHSN